MYCLSVKVEESVVEQLDEISEDLRRETGCLIHRSDVIKQAIQEFIESYPLPKE